ncbi:MAG: ThuA domain-containing protein, partial [Kiritimatiellales bacterium]|nr:ThuA domain-containing protein [Kiritimatiellales bacterium]
MKAKSIVIGLVAVLVAGGASAAKNVLVPPTELEIKNIEQALPASAPAKPTHARKILVFTRCEGFVHKSITIGAKAFEMLGKKTGAFTTEESSDMTAFSPDNLARFDAILFLSTTKLDPSPEQRQALLDFARGGKGIIGIHAASDNFYEWEDGAKMIGGLFCGHPWTAGCTVQVKLDEPDHPLNACFGGQSFKIKDEIYQFKDP